jgi:hypothetical protein
MEEERKRATHPQSHRRHKPERPTPPNRHKRQVERTVLPSELVKGGTHRFGCFAVSTVACISVSQEGLISTEKENRETVDAPSKVDSALPR